MRRRAVLAWLCVVVLAALPMAARAQKGPDLGLIPTPRYVAQVDSSRMVRLDKAKVREKMLDGNIIRSCELRVMNEEQWYNIEFKPGRINVSYYAEEGRQYAHMTLAQLRRLHTEVPSMIIDDWPAFRLRGWMDDISRGPVTHQAYRDRQWQELHGLKLNFCNYYTEHVLYQQEFPDLAPAYAYTRRHPDEFINLQLFAHAEKTLRIPFYQSMMDGKANFNPDTEETYWFLRKRIGEAFRQMPDSPYFIIDCDETEQLGTGRAKRLVDSLGSDEVYVRHINRCYEIIREYSKDIKVVMWGDIVAKNPQMMNQLPDDMIYIMWAYEPLDSYDGLLKPFAGRWGRFWVAASSAQYASVFPSCGRYMKNIANLLRDGHRAGAAAAMITEWDDSGESLFDNAWHAYYWHAEMAWNPLRTDDPEEFRRREARFNRNFARLFYGDTAAATGEASKVEQLYAVSSWAGHEWYPTAALMRPLLNITPDDTGMAADRRVAADMARLAVMHIDSAANPHAHYAVHRMIVTAEKATLRNLIGRGPEGADAALTYAQNVYLPDLFALKREYLRLWDQECGEYERYVVAARFDALAREAMELDRHVFVDVSAGEGENGSLPMVTLHTLSGRHDIRYTLDGSMPNEGSALYTGPFPLERSATIKAVACNEYGEGVVTEQYLLSHKAMGKKITLRTRYSEYKPIYSGGGDEALIDGRLGSDATYADGCWQGYWGDSIDAVIDFGVPTEVHSVDMRFMQNTFDWILAPRSIAVMVSDDGEHWTERGSATFDFDPRDTGMRLRHCNVAVRQGAAARYLRVVVPPADKLPSWHPAPGQPGYLFCDEIVVR